MSAITIDAKAAVDAMWYERLVTATAHVQETFIMLEPDQEQLARQRAKFFGSNCTINPHVRPCRLNDALLAQTTASLQQLQADIAANEPNKFIRAAYEGHIQERLLNLAMMRAVVAGDHQQFVAKNIELYGLPRQDIFGATCAWIRQDALATPVPSDSDIADLRDEVLKLIPDISGDPALLMPNEAIFARVRNMHRASGGYYDQLFAPQGLPDMPYIEQDYGDEITERAIANVGSDYTIKTATDGLWAVLTSTRQVVRPLGYRVDRDYFIGVIAHEVGSHLLEEANGSRQPLRLLRLGLGGFEKGNEGRAYLREQIVYEHEAVFVRQSSWEYILMLHLSVCLASGLHGKPYAFVQLYELLYALHRLWRARRYPMDTNNNAAAQEEAWLLAIRVMKGTDGSGGCYMKDTVYLEGNIACWKLAEQDPRLLLRGDIGKFNVTDPRHITILQGLGIIDKD